MDRHSEPQLREYVCIIHSTQFFFPVLVNTKLVYNICTMLDERRKRWAAVVQMLYKGFVFAGLGLNMVINCKKGSLELLTKDLYILIVILYSKS